MRFQGNLYLTIWSASRVMEGVINFRPGGKEVRRAKTGMSRLAAELAFSAIVL